MDPDGKLVAHATGEVELEGAAERAHGVYADSCPVYRSLKAAIAITTELDFRPE